MIHLIGLGSIGGAYAAMAKVNGYDFKIIVDEARKVRYSKNDFIINGQAFQFQYVTEATETAPLILVVTKSTQLQEAIEAIKPFVAADTIIIPLLNGISAAPIIQANIDKGFVLPGFTVKTDGQRKGHIITYSSSGKIVFGHNDPKDKPVANKAAEMLRTSGVPFEQVDDIQYQQWWKLMANVGINQTQALLGEPYKMFLQEPPRAIARLAMQETVAIANKLNIGLVESNIDEILDLVCTFGLENKTSMLQDVEAKRLTEVDIFAGEIIRLGKKVGVPTPVNELLLNTIRHLESRF